VLALNSLRLDWELVSRTGSIDFRNRITGVRLLFAGEDAYHYKWLPGAPEGWCDVYANRALPVTKTTATPAMLVLGAPLALFPYPVAQRLWLLLEWGFLAGIWWLWWRRSPGPVMRIGWTAVVVGFSYSLAWRHHVDRGQAYIVLAFFISLWLYLSQARPTAKATLSGAIAGLLIGLRPPLLLLLAPFIWMRRPEQRKSAGIGLAAAVLLPFLLNGGSWSQYAQAMGQWSTVYRHNENPSAGPLPYPAVMEGLKLEQLSRYDVPQYADSSIHRLLRACGLATVPAAVPLTALLIALGFWLRTTGAASDRMMLLGLAAWSFLIDFFLPAYRNPYNDVMILGALGCLVVEPHLPRLTLALTAFALGLGWILVSIHPDALWIIHLPTLAWTGVALTCLNPRFAPPAGSLQDKTPCR
jgi:hypothetical protein